MGETMAKRSRRARRQETEKRLQQPDQPAVPKPAAPVQKPVETPAPAPDPILNSDVDFGREYYYVYSDLRNISLVAAAMFVLMFALGYFI